MNAYFLFFFWYLKENVSKRKSAFSLERFVLFEKNQKGLQGKTLQGHQQPQPLLVLKKGHRTTPQTPRQSLARGLTAPPVALTLR